MVGFYTRYINCPPNEISDNVGEAELDQVVGKKIDLLILTGFLAFGA